MPEHGGISGKDGMPERDAGMVFGTNVFLKTPAPAAPPVDNAVLPKPETKSQEPLSSYYSTKTAPYRLDEVASVFSDIHITPVFLPGLVPAPHPLPSPQNKNSLFSINLGCSVLFLFFLSVPR